MNDTPQLEEALALALRLAPRERLQLIERVAASVGDEIAAPAAVEGSSEEHWGRNLLRFLDEIGPIELIHPEIEDPVEWVKAQRDKRQAKLKPYWDAEAE